MVSERCELLYTETQVAFPLWNLSALLERNGRSEEVINTTSYMEAAGKSSSGYREQKKSTRLHPVLPRLTMHFSHWIMSPSSL